MSQPGLRGRGEGLLRQKSDEPPLHVQPLVFVRHRDAGNREVVADGGSDQRFDLWHRNSIIPEPGGESWIGRIVTGQQSPAKVEPKDAPAPVARDVTGETAGKFPLTGMRPDSDDAVDRRIANQRGLPSLEEQVDTIGWNVET